MGPRSLKLFSFFSFYDIVVFLIGANMIDFRTNYGPEFDKVFSEIMDIEGIVMTNDPDDPGGLTICGISRVAHPQWSGWNYTTNFKLNTKVPLDFIVEHVAKFS